MYTPGFSAEATLILIGNWPRDSGRNEVSHRDGSTVTPRGATLAAILDETSGRAHMGEAAAPRFMFTGKLEVKYRKNVPIARPLRVVGKAGRLRARMAESWAGIYDEESGELLAEANALHINVPDEQFNPSRLEELGWKVYEDPANDQAAGERQ